MTAPPTTDSLAWEAPAQVLTDPVLWRTITSFQCGLPRGLYDFWEAHEPSIVHLTDLSKGFVGLLNLVVKHGTVQQLDALSQVKYHTATTPLQRHKTVNFGKLSRQVIEANRVDMLEWAIAHDKLFDPPKSVWKTAIQSYRDGDLRVLDLLRVHKPVDATALPRVLTLYDVELVHWMGLQFPGYVDVRDMTFALSLGNLAIVKFLLDQHPSAHFGRWPIADLAYKRQFDILRCVLEKRPTEIDRGDLVHYMEYENEDVMRVIAEVGAFEDVARKVAESFVSSGNIDKLKLLLDRGLLPSGEPFSLDLAAPFRRLDTGMIKFLDQQSLATATTEAMDHAAEQMRWDVVMYLHHNRSEGCTTRVMDAAADQGRIKDVRFFHENRSEGCTTRAMDMASEKGHFQVVQFLQEHRSEGCTTSGIQTALKNGHLEIVRLLYEHYRSLFGPEMLYDLLLHGAFEIWKGLREIYPNEANAVVEPVLLKAGELLELGTIQFIVHSLGRKDLAYLAVVGAAKVSFTKHAQWVRAVMSVTGSDSCRLSAVRNAVASTGLHNDPARFLISMCSESGATQAAVADAMMSWHSELLVQRLETWLKACCGELKLERSPVHPLLLDTRTPHWALEHALKEDGLSKDPYSRGTVLTTWAVRAIYREDRGFLEMLREFRVNDDPMFSFKGARVAAVRRGNLRALQWLLSNVDLPVEPTLLDEALYYHEFEIAEWLAANCIDGCREIDWDTKVKVISLGACDLDDGVLLKWIEDHAAVRDLVDFGGIAYHAAKCGNVDALRQLHKTHPDVFSTRQDLACPGKQFSKVAKFLKKIKYAFMES